MSYGPYHVIRYPTYWLVQDRRILSKDSLGIVVSKHRSGNAAHRKAASLERKLKKEKING